MIQDDITKVLDLYSKFVFVIDKTDETTFIDYVNRIAHGGNWELDPVETTNFQDMIISKINKIIDKIQVEFIRTPNKSIFNIETSFACIGSIIGDYMFLYDKSFKTDINRIIWFISCMSIPKEHIQEHNIYTKIGVTSNVKTQILETKSLNA